MFTGFLSAFNPHADRIFRVSKGLIHRQAHCYTAWQIRKYHPTNPSSDPMSTGYCIDRTYAPAAASWKVDSTTSRA